jgi:carbonic anhydrase
MQSSTICRLVVPGFLGVFFFFSSCSNSGSNAAVVNADSLAPDIDSLANETGPVSVDRKDFIQEHFITADLQSQLTADTVISILRARNLEYAADNLTIRNTSERIRRASLGQFPAAAVLSCLDSRVPVEDVFHSGIGDLFVARVAGNISNEDILGSLEFACKVSGAKVVLVLGHEHCGAIKSAIDDVKLGNITGLLAKIRPAMVHITGFSGDSATSNNPAYVEAVAKANVLRTIDNIRTHSPILKDMEAQGLIKIIGAEYHMETGLVEFLQ